MILEAGAPGHVALLAGLHLLLVLNHGLISKHPVPVHVAVLVVKGVVVALSLVVELVHRRFVVQARAVEEALLVGVALGVLELSEVQVVSRMTEEAIGVHGGSRFFLRCFGG